MFHTRVKAASRIGPHNLDVISVIVGSLLGDCYANKRSVEGTRLCYRQSTVHKDYLFWLYNFFFTRGYCSNLEPRIYKRVLKNKGSDDKTYYGHEFNTFTFRSFNWVHKMFYSKGKKVLKLEHKYYTPLALAIWSMGSGNYINGKLELFTQFSKEKDILNLINILQDCFGLSCNMALKNKKSYVVIISGQSLKLFQSIVLPYIIPSTMHKIGLCTNPYRNTTLLSNNKGKVLVVTNVVTNDTVSYNSVSDAARALNLNRFTISRRIKDKKILNGLYKFSYV